MHDYSRLEIAPFTTLRLGGPARRMVEASSTEQLVDTVVSADDAGDALLVLGGGSNVVVADAGFDGTVVRIVTRGVLMVDHGESVELVVAAGEPWDDVVATAVGCGLAGIECLSGIPGSTGATPIQNVGAYGSAIDEVVTRVRVWDRRDRRTVDMSPADCGFGYRTSIFKGNARFVVVEVAFTLERSATSRPIRYAELAKTLGVEIGERAPLADVRAAVLGLRRGKGMVLDPDDPDSVSAGSFFTNPVLDADAFARLEQTVTQRFGPDTAPPAWTESDGRTKTSAAWLIERSGFSRGYGDGPVGLSSRHTLALVNRGGATTTQLVALAREVRDGVQATFGVTLHAEPVFVGVQL
jgi:UDP-N-acetylmuramate dehydrogenase